MTHLNRTKFHLFEIQLKVLYFDLTIKSLIDLKYKML